LYNCVFGDTVNKVLKARQSQGGRGMEWSRMPDNEENRDDDREMGDICTDEVKKQEKYVHFDNDGE
jgi:hypothetical protein